MMYKKLLHRIPSRELAFLLLPLCAHTFPAFVEEMTQSETQMQIIDYFSSADKTHWLCVHIPRGEDCRVYRRNLACSSKIK